MPSDDSYQKLLKGLKRLIQLVGTLNEMGVRLARNSRFFYNLFSRRGQMTIQLLMELADHLDLSLRSLAEAIGPAPIDRPETILLLQRESRDLPANAFLDDLKPRCEALLALPVKEEAALASAPPALADLEELRFGNRAAAEERAEALAHELLGTLEAGEGPKSAMALGQLAATVALWGTIQRGKGLRDLAIKAFAQAFPIARHSGDSWSLGNCYQRAAQVFRDLDRADLSYGFINQAMGYYGATMALSDVCKSQADKASFYFSLGMMKEAKAAFLLALRYLPGAEWRYRGAAYQGLGAIARKEGDLETARVFLFSAASEFRQPDHVLGHIKWSQAKTEALLNQEVSLGLFREAIELFQRFGSAGDVALVCVDYAEVLFKLKKNSQLILLISEVLSWLPKMQANPILLRALKSLLDLARSARLDLKGLEGTRAAVLSAHKEIQRLG